MCACKDSYLPVYGASFVVLGLIIDWLNSVVAAIGAAYGRKYLTLTWVFCATRCAFCCQSGTGLASRWMC